MWLSNPGYIKNLDSSKLLPASIHRQADYLIRLQERALLIDSGDFTRLEDHLDRREIIAFKNKHLAAVYGELKVAIRVMTYT